MCDYDICDREIDFQERYVRIEYKGEEALWFHPKCACYYLQEMEL